MRDRAIIVPVRHTQGGSRWKPGDRALIELAENEHGQKSFEMATLVIRDSVGQWWFKLDGATYPQYEGGPELSFCVERWLHDPPVLQRLAEI
jgi:hypothetical protein